MRSESDDDFSSFSTGSSFYTGSTDTLSVGSEHVNPSYNYSISLSKHLEPEDATIVELKVPQNHFPLFNPNSQYVENEGNEDDPMDEEPSQNESPADSNPNAPSQGGNGDDPPDDDHPNDPMDEDVSSDNRNSSFMSYALSQLGKVLVEQLRQEFEDTNNISPDLLVSLHEVYGDTFMEALEEADLKPLIVFKSTAGQLLWKIQAENDTDSIFILPHVNYCKCEDYSQYVLHAKTKLSCKHYLAAEVNYARKMYELKNVSDFIMRQLLVSVYISSVNQSTIPTTGV